MLAGAGDYIWIVYEKGLARSIHGDGGVLGWLIAAQGCL